MAEAIGVYALGTSAGESARLQRQADELAADSAALLDRPAFGRETMRSILAAARGGFWTCWPGGCHRAAGWAMTSAFVGVCAVVES